MKKTFYQIGMLALAAIAFVGCTKEIDTPREAGTHTIMVTVQNEVDSKTAIVEGATEASYVWTEDDDQYFHIYENGVEALAKTMTLSQDRKTATFTATFTENDASELVYTAKYAKSISGSGNPAIQTEQSPELASFDPSADVMISNAITATSQPQSLLFSLRRVISVNKMTLKELEEGEVISTVEISADKAFGGYFIPASVNPDSGDPVAEHYSSSGKKITLTYDPTKVNAVVPATGEFPVYFICGPVEGAKISVRVVTDKNVYERGDFNSTVDFRVGTVKRFGVKLGNYGTPIATGTTYTLVENQADLVAGATYLIYGGGHVLGEQKTNNRGAVAVTPENNVIIIDNTIDAYPVIIEAVSGGYSIKDINNSGYLYNDKSTNNYLKNTADLNAYTTWTIDIKEGVAHIDNVNTNVRGKICYNPNNNSPLFAAYSSIPTNGTSDLALYIDLTTAVPDTRQEAGMSWSSENASASIEDGDVINFTAPTLTVGNATGITFESTDENVATISAAGEVSILAAGTTTINAIFAGDTDYKPQTVSYTLTVTDNRTPASTTIADVLAGGAGSYEVADVLVYAVKGSGLIIGDATGKMYAYKSNHGLSAGDVRTVNGTTTIYNDAYEFDAPTFSGTGTATVNHGTAVELDSQASALQSAFANPSTAVYVHAIGSQSGRNITTTGGSALYLSATESATDGKTVEIYGYVYAYSTSHSNFDILVTRIEEYVDPNAKSITALKSSITGISADGVTNATETGVYSLTNASDSDVTVTPDGTVVTSASVSGGTLTYSVAANTGAARSGSVTLAVSGGNSIEITISQEKASGSSGGTMSIDFESAASTYGDWTFTNIQTQMTNSNVPAKEGSYFGTTTNDNGNAATASSIVTKSPIANPASLVFYITKQTTNTNASSVWKVSVSSNGSSWTQVGVDQAAASGVTRGTWIEVSRDLSSYSNVYVKIEYAGSNAIRCIDKVELTYN